MKQVRAVGREHIRLQGAVQLWMPVLRQRGARILKIGLHPGVDILLQNQKLIPHDVNIGVGVPQGEQLADQLVKKLVVFRALLGGQLEDRHGDMDNQRMVRGRRGSLFRNDEHPVVLRQRVKLGRVRPGPPLVVIIPAVVLDGGPLAGEEDIHASFRVRVLLAALEVGGAFCQVKANRLLREGGLSPPLADGAAAAQAGAV